TSLDAMLSLAPNLTGEAARPVFKTGSVLAVRRRCGGPSVLRCRRPTEASVGPSGSGIGSMGVAIVQPSVRHALGARAAFFSDLDSSRAMTHNSNSASRRRCDWAGATNPAYIAYHDEQWGVPVHDDRTQFEFLILEGAQAGLSWWTILSRRE